MKRYTILAACVLLASPALAQQPAAKPVPVAAAPAAASPPTVSELAEKHALCAKYKYIHPTGCGYVAQECGCAKIDAAWQKTQAVVQQQLQTDADTINEFIKRLPQ